MHLYAKLHKESKPKIIIKTRARLYTQTHKYVKYIYYMHSIHSLEQGLTEGLKDQVRP